MLATAFWFATGLLNVLVVCACVALATYVIKAWRR